MSSLDRTIPLPKTDHIPESIRKDLYLDMPWPFQPSLQQHLIIAERFQSFSLGSHYFLLQNFWVGGSDDPHSFSSASMGRFDEEWESDLFGGREEGRDILCCPMVASTKSAA
jgi:hypothetical protein